MHTEVENRQPGKISLWKAVFFTTILLLVATSVVAKGPKPATVDMQDAQGKSIETIEGFTSDTRMHPVSAAFVQHDAQQCGYCTPGFVVAAKNFLDRHPNPTYEEVEKGLGGNLCRCGTYVGVRSAVLAAAKNMKGGNHA